MTVIFPVTGAASADVLRERLLDVPVARTGPVGYITVIEPYIDDWQQHVRAFVDSFDCDDDVCLYIYGIGQVRRTVVLELDALLPPERARLPQIELIMGEDDTTDVIAYLRMCSYFFDGVTAFNSHLARVLGLTVIGSQQLSHLSGIEAASGFDSLTAAEFEALHVVDSRRRQLGRLRVFLDPAYEARLMLPLSSLTDVQILTASDGASATEFDVVIAPDAGAASGTLARLSDQGLFLSAQAMADGAMNLPSDGRVFKLTAQGLWWLYRAEPETAMSAAIDHVWLVYEVTEHHPAVQINEALSRLGCVVAIAGPGHDRLGGWGLQHDEDVAALFEACSPEQRPQLVIYVDVNETPRFQPRNLVQLSVPTLGIFLAPGFRSAQPPDWVCQFDYIGVLGSGQPIESGEWADSHVLDVSALFESGESQPSEQAFADEASTSRGQNHQISPMQIAEILDAAWGRESRGTKLWAAFTYLAGGQIEAAHARFRQILERFPACAPALTGIGRCLLAQGRVDDARLTFYEALRKQRDANDPRRALNEMNGLPADFLSSDAEPVQLTSIVLTGDFDSSVYSRAVRDSFADALVGSHRLPEWLITLDGMSGKRYRFFINHLLRRLEGARYLEVGSWSGSTACSAIWDNTLKAFCIDNWSEFGGPRDQFMANVGRAMNAHTSLELLEKDFRLVDWDALGKFNVYMFDGPHLEHDQYDGVVLAQPALDDCYVLIVDDYNDLSVRVATTYALERLGSSLVCAIEIRTTQNNMQPHLQKSRHLSDWHNGYFIGVVKKGESGVPDASGSLVASVQES